MQLNWTERIPLTKSGVSRIKAVAGVYRLIYHNVQKDKYHIYYVGQAEDLNERLGQHLPDTETSKCCKGYLDGYTCYLRAAAISRQTDRDGAEVALYNHFKPTCVERIPDVDPIEINFD